MGKLQGRTRYQQKPLKQTQRTAVNMLHSLFSKIWEKEEVPAQWKEGIVIKLPKKGDLRDCSNYRGIMLLSVPGKVLNRILLERMREAVDPMLRDQQAGFRRNRSCADQIASLRIIVEQSLEWNSPLYINFIDYEKAFDSVDREALWKLLRHYGVPGKIISLIQCTYQDMSCRIAHAGQLSESFEVKTGVRQGCLLSPFLFLLVIDWIMKTTTAGRKNGIQWTLWTQLDDLDFADDLALLSHGHSQMQDKTTCLEATSAGTGLKINRKKTELMKINTTANTPVTVGGEPIREVESFVYLGSVVDGQGGTDRDVTARIGKARAAMVMLKNVWASKVVSIRTKLRIFNSNVKSVLLYGCETWRTTKTMQQKIQTFLNTCLRRIFNIRWPEKIRNEELWERAGQEPVAKQILRRKWGWIGHTLRKPASSTTRQALTWNPQGKRKRGRPRNSWRRDTEAELFLKKRGSESTGRTLASSSEISDDVNTSAVDETDSISVADAEGASGRAGSSPPWSSTGVFPAGLARRHSVGNTVGYKVDEKTRHTSCFNICPKTQSVEDTNFLELTPNTVVRQVQKQLGLHTRMSEPVMFGAVDCTKEVEQLERAINVLQMTMSNPDVDASLLEPLGQHKRRTIIKVQRETGEDGAAPKRRHCEACGHPKGRYNDPGVVRPAPTYNKPRWQIPPVGRLRERERSKDKIIQTTGSRSDPSLASHRGVVGSAVSLRDRSKPPAAPPGKGPFDAVVYMMAEANRPESELMLPDLQQPRHRLLNRNLQLLRSRNVLTSLSSSLSSGT
nr:hypothetical protein BaRGS_013792 [Batillaria attramentaria]